MNKDSNAGYNDKALLFDGWMKTITVASVEKGIENTVFEDICWDFIGSLGSCIQLFTSGVDGADTNADAIIADAYKLLFEEWREMSTLMPSKLEVVLRLMLEDFSEIYPNTKQVQDEMK